MRERIAPDGQIWVCGACGRTGKDRYSMGDTSCITWAVLCFDNGSSNGWEAVPRVIAVGALTSSQEKP